MGGTTSATGGSATSQAEERTWRARPGVARLIRVVILLLPIAVSFAITRIYAQLVDSATIGVPAYWAGIMALAIAVAIVTEHKLQAVIPLAALFNMSLVFPDQAPSRFGVALRSGTAKRLKDRADETGDSGPAEDLLHLVKTLGAHDPKTRGHSERVRAYADLIAQEMGLSEDDRNKLAWGALAHDVGKLDVRQSTLNKDGRPNDEEWEEIRGHPGAAIHRMAPLAPWLGDWALAASEHHERWDGKGYPLGLKGEEISLAGRIVAVADAYDVMTSARSYKPPLSAEAARSELINNAETQFDPEVVRAFLGAGIRQVRMAGPLAWLGEFAWFVRVPQAVGTAASTAATATVSVAAVVASPFAPVGPQPSPELDLAAERIVVEEQLDEPIEVVTTTTEGTDRAIVTTTIPTDATPTTTVTVEPTVTTTAAPTTTAPTAATTTTTSAPAAAPTTTTTIPLPASTPTTTTIPLPASAPTTTTIPLPASTPTTTTTAAPAATPTTTTTAPLLPAGMFLTSTAGASESFSKLDGELGIGSLGNYDVDRNDDPGLTLKRGDGLGEVDPAKRHRFWAALPGLDLVGTPQLEIWVATRDYDQDKTGVVLVSLEDCAANKSDCNVISTGLASFDQSAFGAAFGRVVVSLDPIDHELVPSRSLMLNLHVHDGSEDDLWFAYGTTTYPAALRIS